METTYRISFDSRSAAQRAKAFRKELELTERTTGRLDRQTGLLGASYRQLSGVLAGYAGIAGFRQVISDVSTLENINARISNLTGDLANEQRFLRQTSQELSASYVNLAQGYSKLLPLQQAGVISSKENREITKGLANVQAAAGASASQLGQTMFGLAQGLTAGTLRAEELNQVTEPMPGLLQALDRASGQAAGGFRKLVVEGKITSDVFKGILITALKDYEGAAASLSGNISQSFTRVQNEYIRLVDELAVPINSALVPFANSLEAVLSNVADNAGAYIDTLGTVAQVTAAAFGARAIGELQRYGQQQLTNAANSLNLAKATAAEAQANNVAAASKVRQAAAVADYTAIQLRETQQRALSITGIQRLTFVTTELAAAERAAAVATTNLAAAEKAAVATNTALTAAQARTALSARALAGAMGLANSAMALVGGPIGVAALAAYGVYLFVDSLEDQETKADQAVQTLDEIAESYKRTGDSAEEAAKSSIALAEAQLEEAKAALAAREARNQALRDGGATARDLDFGGVSQSDIDELEQSIAEARNRVTTEAFKLGQEAMAQAVAGASNAGSAGALRKTADELLSSLFPSDAKIQQLEGQLEKVRDLFSKGIIDESELARAESEIRRRISSLDGTAESSRRTEQATRDLADATRDYHDIISGYEPNFAAQFQYEDNVNRLEEAHRTGAISAVEYESTLADLDQALEREFVDLRIEKERELRDLLNQGVDNSEIDRYNDSILMLSRAMEDMPEKAEQIQRAMHGLNATFLESQSSEIEGIVSRFNAGPSDPAEALAATQSSESEQLERALAERRRIILEYKATEHADIAQANSELTHLEVERISAVNQLEANHAQQRLEQSQRFNQEFISESQSESEFRRDSAIRAGMSVEQAEAAHQDRLAVIREFAFDAEALRRQYEAGQLAATEYHTRREELEIEHQERLAGIQRSASIAQYDREIGLANSLFDIYEQSLGRKSDRALTNAKEARELADDATGAEKEALEEQAIQAEAYARKRFNDEKKASIAQARVQQALAVVKAWTSGATIYDQIANAAIAFAGTESVIQDLKSQQFNSGNPIGGGGSGAGASGGGGGGGDLVNGQDINSQTPNVTFNVFTADEIIDQDKLKDTYLQFTDESVRDGAIRNENGEITVNHLG